MKMLRSLGIVLGCGLMVGANAQPQADIATDQELFAGYCLGAIIAEGADSASISMLEKTLGHVIAQQHKESLNQKRLRFLGYLTARGLLSGARGSSATTGVRLANERGRADTPRCAAKKLACVDKLPFKKMDDLKLVKNCSEEEDACRKTARCYDDDRLPF